MSDIADRLEEADELLSRYSGAVLPTFDRNIETLTMLLVVHRLWQEPNITTGDLIREMSLFMRAAFRMGQAAGIMED